MGGHSATVIDDVEVEYGDICEIEVWDGEDWLWKSVTFVEVSDDGDLWFRYMCEEDSTRGSEMVADYYSEVDGVRFVRKKDDPSFDLGSGI
jgi:hypothetical protein